MKEYKLERKWTLLCVRCPACGKSLDRLGVQPSREPFFCPRCGAKINRE